MSTFKEMRRLTSILKQDICSATGLKQSLVHNVIQYARRLAHPSRPDVIEELVFVSQMGKRFGITSMFHLKLMFDAVRIRDTRLVKVDDYTRLVCTFYSNNLDLKIDFVFSVYDFYKDKQICPKEMMALLQTAIVSPGDEDAQEQLKELIDIVLLVFDTDGDGQISLEEFRSLVHKNILYIQLLGQVLPHKDTIHGFMNLLNCHTPLEVRVMFEHERADSLREPRDLGPKLEDYFNVTLELP